MKRKNAFTLVELLVVIAIIGILSSLITVAVGGARKAIQRGMISTELGQIAIAIDKYKTTHGEYPPDLYDSAATLRHVKKRWPRFTLSSTPSQIAAFNQAINNVYRNPQVLNSLAGNYGYTVSTTTVFMDSGAMYISAVPFWLGGFPNRDGKFDGFSADPMAPFGRIYDSGNQDANGNDIEIGINDGGMDVTTNTDYYVSLGTQTKDAPIEMELGKQILFAQNAGGTIAYQCFVHKVSSSNVAPYVYFRGRSGGGPLAYFYDVYSGGTHVGYAPKQYVFATVFGTSTFGIATPYAKRGNPFLTGSPDISVLSWYEPDKFQLVHPGLGGVFGSVLDSGTVPIGPSGSSMDYTIDYFRSVNTAADRNNIGKEDFDNITNFSNGGELKAITE